MPDTPAVIHERISRTNKQLLALVSDLTDEQFARRHGPRAPSVRFHIFHVSRWSDQVQSWLPDSTPQLAEKLGRRPQVWDAQEVAKAWGMAAYDLGDTGHGAGMSDDDAASLPLPARDVLLAYTKDAFAELEQALGQIGPAHFDIECKDFPGRVGTARWRTVGGAIVHHLVHINRHLGMIEALRGVMDMRGTATS